MEKKLIVLLLISLYLHACSTKSSVEKNVKLMEQKLELSWKDLIRQFTNDEQLITHSWEQIKQHYTEKNRAYHNLTHINNMLQEAAKFDHKIIDKTVLFFAIWFHDIIYDPLSKTNEKDSAEFAKKMLSQTNLSPASIQKCYDLILLTIKHQPDKEAHLDDKLLVDFDLEILSRDWEAYKIYSEQVRKEYWMYPAPLFKNGRKAAMGKFLERPTIYQTPFYQKEKEAKARANIQREIEELL